MSVALSRQKVNCLLKVKATVIFSMMYFGKRLFSAATERVALIERVTEIMHFNPFIIEKDKKICEMILFGFPEITHWKIEELLYT